MIISFTSRLLFGTSLKNLDILDLFSLWQIFPALLILLLIVVECRIVGDRRRARKNGAKDEQKSSQ